MASVMAPKPQSYWVLLWVLTLKQKPLLLFPSVLKTQRMQTGSLQSGDVLIKFPFHQTLWPCHSLLITASVRVLGNRRCPVVRSIAMKIPRVGQRNPHLRCPATSSPRNTKTEHTRPSGEPEQKLRTKVQCLFGF